MQPDDKVVRYRVSQIKRTWQGEGLYAGEPIILVRFAGCNLHCSFCDERSMQQTKSDVLVLTEDELIKRIQFQRDCSNGVSTILFTGGEPFLQLKLRYTLISTLVALQFMLFVETNGTTRIPFGMERNLCVTVSPKYGAPIRIQKADVLKYVVPGDWPSFTDFLTHVVLMLNKFPKATVFVQPQADSSCVQSKGIFVHSEIALEWADKLIVRGIPVLLSVQMHKVMGFE